MKLNDKNVEEVLRSSKAELAEIESLLGKRAKYETNGHFETPGGKRYNLHVAQTAERVVDFLSTVYLHANSREKAHKRLGVTSDPIFSGFAITDWETDCETKLSLLNAKARKSELVKIINKLETLLTEEHRQQKEFEALISASTSKKQK